MATGDRVNSADARDCPEMPPPELVGQGSVNNFRQNMAAPESTRSIQLTTLRLQAAESTRPMPELAQSWLQLHQLWPEHDSTGGDLDEDGPPVNGHGSWARSRGKAGGIVGRRAGSPVIEDFNKFDTMMKVWISASR
mmetsp:Transcript_57796/g.122602  ORF Transcript_57796/g.122602 Transcript_57796/m.122602 type:complete len:137 (+) Transcript_57796:237-647(+)